MAADIHPSGKIVRYKYGSRENFKKLNVIVQKVEMYLDAEGCFYVVPVEDEELDIKGSFSNFDFEIESSGDNPFI